MTSPEDYLASHRGWRRWVVKAGRNWRWGRTRGWSELVEEHDLNPAVRIPRALRTRRWVRAHGRPGAAVPVFLVGVQRSGTNMLTHGLDEAPGVQVFNEGDRRAFVDYRLKPLPAIERLVRISPFELALFKPLCDSHLVDQLLGGLETPKAPKAVWAWRNVDGRAASAVEKFASSNLEVLKAWVDGRAEGHWQMQRLSAASGEFVRGLAVDRLSPESGAAVFWYIRNCLYFELGLDARRDVFLLSYDDFVNEPELWMRRLTGFLGIDFDPRLVAHVKPARPTRRKPLEIEPTVRARCDELHTRLVAATQEQLHPA